LGIRYLGGPTALVDIAGLRLLTDPTFDPAGPHPVARLRWSWLTWLRKWPRRSRWRLQMTRVRAAEWWLT
jgi:L-ascorbate metabolism protein UlaG (beta-lactamase superfamily)